MLIGLHRSFEECIQIRRFGCVLLHVALSDFKHFVEAIMKFAIVVPHDDRVFEFDINSRNLEPIFLSDLSSFFRIAFVVQNRSGKRARRISFSFLRQAI